MAASHGPAHTGGCNYYPKRLNGFSQASQYYTLQREKCRVFTAGRMLQCDTPHALRFLCGRRFLGPKNRTELHSP